MPPTLTLTQIEAPAPGELPKSLALSGSCGPMEEIEWGGTQRAQVEPIPGNPRASVRLDGPEEDEVTIEFVWRSRHLAPGEAKLDDVPVTNAVQLVEVVDLFRQEPALVRLNWQQRSMVGVVIGLKAREMRFHEYEATLTFRPIEPPNYRERERVNEPNPRSLIAQIADDFETTIATAERAATQSRQWVDDAAQYVADVRGTLSRMRAVVEAPKVVGRDAKDVSRAVASGLDELLSTSGAALDTVSMPYNTLAETDEYFAQMLARRAVAAQSRAHRTARVRAALERSRYRPESDILGIHDGVQGETVWSVAWRWYGDVSDEAAAVIRRRNGLFSTDIRAGQRLVIPRRGAA